MAQMARRIAYPLTFVLKQEGDQWAALAPELNVASCGGTLEEARRALEDALETYVSYMIGAGRGSEVARSLSQAEVDDFVNDPPGVVRFERWVMFVALDAAEKASEAAAAEFLPAGLPGAAAAAPAGGGE